MKYYLQAFRKYAQFTGRSTRKEYWYFVLFNTIFTYATILIPYYIEMYSSNYSFWGVMPFWIYCMGAMLPSLAVGVRRMHDVGKSGWFILIPIYSLVLAVMASEPMTNKWGNPVRD